MHYCESCPDPTLMEPASGTAACPACGREEAAPTEPFLVVTGASGSGKSTLLDPLARELAGEAAVFDIDSLIAPFNMQADGVGVDWAAVRAAWLSVGHGPAAGGLPTVLLGPLAPFHLQDLRQTRWVRSLHFFLLDCPDPVRRERLEARPPCGAASGNAISRSRRGGARGCASTSTTALTPEGRASTRRSSRWPRGCAPWSRRRGGGATTPPSGRRIGLPRSRAVTGPRAM